MKKRTTEITTIAELVEKMRTELPNIDGEPNGCYALVRYCVDRDIKSVKDDYDNQKIGFVSAFNRLREYYNFLNGLLWGLYSTGFITDNERDKIREDVLSLTTISVTECEANER